MPKCITPFTVKHKLTQDSIQVPCGKCPSCVSRRVSGWSYRLMQEEKNSTSAHFLTLTYDTATVPITTRGFMSIKKRDVQLFMKRLRKLHPSGTKLKYYLVGEYGGKTNRPHYHAILFNADITKIQLAWTLGNIHYGSVSGASVGYTLKYISKPKKIPVHHNDDRSPEFGLMSKGLGKSYLTDASIKWHHQKLDTRMYVVLQDGKKVSMPRYYKDKIYTEMERKRVAFLTRIQMIERQKDLEQKYGPNYTSDKAQNDIAAFARMKLNNAKGQKL